MTPYTRTVSLNSHGLLGRTVEHAYQHATPSDTERGTPALSISCEKDADPSNPHIVDWDGPLDMENPRNLPTWRKWIITISLSTFNLTTTYSSSTFSTALGVTAKQFDVSEEVMILGTSLMLVGFVVGPFVFGPLSELYGRRRPLFVGFFLFIVFQIPTALAPNLQTLLVCRFLQGIFGAAAPAITGGGVADIWDAHGRGYAIPAFAASLYAGPIFGPIIGAFVVESYLGWPWLFWLTGIMAILFGVLGFLIIPETYAPVLLTRRAKRLRKEPANVALRSPRELENLTFRYIIEAYLLRPFKMLLFEPILLLLTIYMGFIFGLIYLCFEAFPISYSGERQWSGGVATLPFLAVLIGALCACLMVALTNDTRLSPDPKQGRPVENRLVLMAVGGVSLPIGLFWFAWTSFPGISPWPQIVAGVPIGFGTMTITIQGFNYVIDCYAQYAASALAANSCLRYLAAAGFPLFCPAMYQNLGVRWASTVLAFASLALVPIPILFYTFGPKLRQWSKYTPESTA